MYPGSSHPGSKFSPAPRPVAAAGGSRPSGAGQGANQYVKNRTATATPAQLVALLYDGLLASLRRAGDALEGGRREVASDQLLRAQRIIVELRCSLNFDAGELAQSLDAIYDFAWRQIVQANVRRDAQLVRQVVGLLVPLREAWGQSLLGEGDVERMSA